MASTPLQLNVKYAVYFMWFVLGSFGTFQDFMVMKSGGFHMKYTAYLAFGFHDPLPWNPPDSTMKSAVYHMKSRMNQGPMVLFLYYMLFVLMELLLQSPFVEDCHVSIDRTITCKIKPRTETEENFRITCWISFIIEVIVQWNPGHYGYLHHCYFRSLLCIFPHED